MIFGSTLRRAKKHPRSAPAAAINGRLGASVHSPSSARESCRAKRAKGSASASCASMAAVPNTAAVAARLRSVGAMPRPRVRHCAPSRVDATLMPAEASETNTI